ncbi:response regulator [Laspinema olomoucense]|uniref:histidine kinase n=1 Tax=Laspinema olomoucense D3b TaxID=2953688 RepID=A0ABT2N3S0_9CYAN|nr:MULTISPECIES: response regulator [unclassified Laspinema]MCT7977336.1 response regulator [Laspinema sp. D3b]MCT7990801.1 response regulator [Laspinema sp. D3a]MCT7995457.1 response regulator [Laspinema sp. D3c]
MPPKILFVDDEPSFEKLIRRQFRKQIRSEQYEFVFAGNGVEALEALQSEAEIKVTITDINMPQMNGLTLLEKIRELDSSIETVVVSAYSDMKNIRTAMNRGAFDFLTKPIDFEDLEITINRALEQVQRLREDRKKLLDAQTQMIQNEKMTALGQLVAGVAHEINNPVGFIASNIEIAEDYMNGLIELIQSYQGKFPEPGEDITEKIHEIDLEYIVNDVPEVIASMKEGSERICYLSNSLRTFSRSDTTTKIPFNIHDGIDSTLLILKHRLKSSEIRPSIEVKKDYAELSPVICYPGQLNQVFMNLIANAIDALDEASVGRDWAEMMKNQPNIITVRTYPIEGDRVAISIADNGPGMSEEVMGRVFEYLYTTKPVGTGTGLGLYISHQIIADNHGGKLRCVSSPGQGAEFIIELPMK